MSPDSEPLRRVPAPAAELDSEREVDFGVYTRRILGKWWLLVLGAVVGGVLGFLYGQTGGSTYQAEATVYLGQPLSHQRRPVPSLSSDPTGVATLARSQAVVQDVAAEVGIPAGKLRRNISRVLGERNNRQSSSVALIGIRVRGSDGQKVENAANPLGEEVVDGAFPGYVDAKTEGFQARLESQKRELESRIDQRIDQLKRDQPPPEAPTRTRALREILASLAEQRRGQLIELKTETEILLSLAAENVERGKQVTARRSPRK